MRVIFYIFFNLASWRLCVRIISLRCAISMISITHAKDNNEVDAGKGSLIWKGTEHEWDTDFTAETQRTQRPRFFQVNDFGQDAPAGEWILLFAVSAKRKIVFKPCASAVRFLSGR